MVEEEALIGLHDQLYKIIIKWKKLGNMK